MTREKITIFRDTLKKYNFYNSTGLKNTAMSSSDIPIKHLTNDSKSFITSATNDCSIATVEPIQALWSGYGQILRVYLSGGNYPSVILKHIRLPKPLDHPRGWNSSTSHQRKLKSYQVETYWYQHYAYRCNQYCPIPQCIGVKKTHTEIYILLTDLSVSGFPLIKTSLSTQDVHACLTWLAHFHATFLQESHDGLWACGTYWHLDARPDELAALEDLPLKQTAHIIDQTLKQCRYKTLVHGDAKLSNFCFAPATKGTTSSPVAAVDFQYVGTGCGMKDVAYFLGSCLSDNQCENHEYALLNHYFKSLQTALKQRQSPVNASLLEQEWRSLFDVAWADFHRFLKGWSPGHWKLNSYSEKLTQRVIKRLL